MKYLIGLILTISLLAQPTAVVRSNYTVAGLGSASSNNGTVRIIKDGSSSSDCTVGGGSSINFCRSNGSAWVIISLGGGATPAGSVGQAQLNGGGGIFSVNTTSPTTVSVSSVLAPTIGNTELLTNGTFQTGDLTGWTVDPTMSWTNVANQAVGMAGGTLSQSISGMGKVWVEAVLATRGAGFGLEVTNGTTFYFTMVNPGTYTFIMDSNAINFLADGDGWVLASVSVKSYTSGVSAPFPAFISLTNSSKTDLSLPLRFPDLTLGLGYDALKNNGGLYAMAVGHHAGENNMGDGLSAFGYYAGQNNTGYGSSFLGQNAGEANTGSYVTAMGYSAAAQNIGNSLTAVGKNAAASNTNANVTVIGIAAAQNNTGGFLVAVGENAANANTGNDVTVSGFAAAENNTGNGVTVNGKESSQNNTGPYLLASGYRSARSIGDGTNSAFYGSGDTLIGTDKDINNSVVLGTSTTLSGFTAVNASTGNPLTNIIAINGTATASNQTVIGNSSTVSTQLFGTTSSPLWGTATRCSDAGSPAMCVDAASGDVALPTGITSVSLVVNTTAVTANSAIHLQADDSLIIAATTCNSILATLVGGMAITARTPGTSFTITYSGTIATNPLCLSYSILN